MQENGREAAPVLSAEFISGGKMMRCVIASHPGLSLSASKIPVDIRFPFSVLAALETLIAFAKSLSLVVSQMRQMFLQQP